MSFDAKRFKNAKFSPRTEEVPAPELADFFADPAAAVFTIRGLSGVESGRCNEAAERNRNRAAIAEGIASGQAPEITAAVKELLGAGDQVPQDIAKRIEILILGAVEPQVDKELALKICRVYPLTFFDLTSRILQLTGRGHVPGKPPGSGKAKK
jgi:hypothetical protein